jgi:hypothetical protein
MAELPKTAEIVRVRQRQYLVEEVVPPAAGDDATLVRMSCLDDDAQGQPLEVLWEKELDSERIAVETWNEIATRGFDPPKLFSAYLHTLQWNCVTSTDPNLFQSPFRAGIRIDAYQLEPLQKALRLPRVNLFIADDVGLGKTIEAGLIARELLLRKKVQDIVVSCPPSMLLQWQDELEDRFGMIFQILDKDYIARVRQERGYGVNPWTTHSRFLVSHRLLIDEAYTATLRDWLGDFRPGSLLILDEAHHAARRAARGTPSTQGSHGPSVTWPVGSSTGSFSRPRLTMGTQTAFPLCSRSSTRNASAGACPSAPRKFSTPSWSGGSRRTSGPWKEVSPSASSSRST